MSTRIRFSHLLRSVICFALSILLGSFCGCAPETVPEEEVEPEASSFPEIYIGAAETMQQMLDNPQQWEYVQQNADGLYVNFITMDNDSGRFYDDEDLQGFAQLFTNKNVLIESDTKDSTMEREKDYIDRLHAAGFAIPYTSLNYGWNQERQENLKAYDLLEKDGNRLCFVQQGPWVIGGDITRDYTLSDFSNAQYREWLAKSDGFSTDGPMGLWASNSGRMQQGSFSMVKYAHSQGKKALVMICPYTANNPDYSEEQFFTQAKSCIIAHEDNEAEPDIWAIFEYASLQPAVPEKLEDGSPANTLSGVAYYLLMHTKGEPDTLQLSATDSAGTVREEVKIDASAPEGTTYTYTLSLTNSSQWCDYAAVLQAEAIENQEDWSVQLLLDDKDITADVLGNGYKFYKSERLFAGETVQVTIHLTKKTSEQSDAFQLDFSFLPHEKNAAMDTLQITAES